jgi:S-DNA-T family DNA segregation ATPase FtsK/SpoIIIE
VPGESADPILLVVDDATELVDSEVNHTLERLVRRGRDVGVRVVAGAEIQAAKLAYGGFIKELKKEAHGLLLDPDLDLDGDLLGVRLPRGSRGPMPPGRGYHVASGILGLVQIARG